MTTPVKKVPIHLQSAQNRLLIKNGAVVNEDGIEHVDVYIEDCKIKQVGNHLIIPGGTRTIDATDKLILPGGIDASVHLQRPFGDGPLTQSVDDFYQGTRAAVIGGSTTVVNVVVPEPEESLVDAVNKWRGWAEDKACCDYAFKVAVGPKHSKTEMEMLTGEDFGINTFCLSLNDGMRSFRDSEDLMRMFECVRKLGGMAHVHAESGELVEVETESLLARGISGPEGFAMAHSEAAEEEATMRSTSLANQMNCPVLVGPITSPSAADIVKRKKSNGAVVFGATTPATLACDGREYWNQSWRHAAGFVCSPPIRKGKRDEMLDLLVKMEALSVLESDHCTFNACQKALGAADFTKIPTGVNGIESRLSILWERAVHSGLMDPTKFVAATSSIPAKLLGIYPDKGRIEVGAAADVVVWNPNATKKISANDHQLKVDFNIFEGMECHGVAETVVCQGKIMLDDGQIRVMQGFGRFLPLRPHAPFVYDLVKAKEEMDAAPRPVPRTESDMTVVRNGTGDTGIPPPTPPKVNHAVPAPSQHQSNFDLRSHPDTPDFDASRDSPARSSVRVRAPPGGRSSGGFW